MEVILLTAIILCTACNIFVVRYFLKQVSAKIEFNSSFSSDGTGTTTEYKIGTTPPQQDLAKFNFQYRQGTNGATYPVDAPATNEVMEADPNEIDLQDTNFNGNVPTDIKLEVEGGDTAVPPEMEDKVIRK